MRTVIVAAAVGLFIVVASPLTAHAWKLGQPVSKLASDTERDLRRSDVGRWVHNPGKQAKTFERGVRQTVVDPVKEELREFDRKVIRPLTPGTVLENGIARAGQRVTDRIFDSLPGTMSELQRVATTLLMFASMMVVGTWMAIRCLKVLFALPAALLRRKIAPDVRHITNP